jgi:outer membrane protein assembly factor BamD
MTRKTIAKCLLPLVLLAFTANCGTIKGWFGKTKTDKPPDIMAREGINQLKKQKYDDAIDTFEKVKDRYPYSDQALLAQIKLADAYFYKRKYDEALASYKEFEKLHPTNKAVPYCIYREGLCYYRQRSTIDRDQSYTQRALGEFKRLKQKFPQSEYMPKADKYMAHCRRDLAEHEYYVAEFYYRTKRYPAALERYQTLVEEYPEFPNNVEARKRIESCQKILAAPEKQNKGFFSVFTNLFDAKW